MDFFDVIEKRCSYRGEFLDTPIPDEDMRRIMEAGIKAPSGHNLQTTSFIVVTDPQLRQHLASILPTKATKTAPAFIVALSEAKPSPGSNLCFAVEDYAAAVENILLAITALGYGAVWLDGMTREASKSETIRELLHIPAEKYLHTIIPLGRPKEPFHYVKKQPLEERVTYI